MTEERVEDPGTFKKVIAKLEAANIVFDRLEHAAVKTSEEAAQVRNGLLAAGAKALLIRAKTDAPLPLFVMCVMSAEKKLNSKGFRSVLKAKSISFATQNEVWEVTKCIPGAVPPFGSLFGLQTYLDPSLQTLERIEFNAGLRTQSVRMLEKDYEIIEKPIVQEICEQ
jgi:Ala-tRNA(Pro) deacylase